MYDFENREPETVSGISGTSEAYAVAPLIEVTLPAPSHRALSVEESQPGKPSVGRDVDPSRVHQPEEKKPEASPGLSLVASMIRY